MTLRNAVALLLLFASLLTSAAQAAEEAILLIDQVSGAAGVQRDGKRLALLAGDALQEQDLIVTERSGRMTLRLGRHGFVEVGPNSDIGVERLPFAAYARDLKSIFSVSKGYFRMVWKHPQLSTNWPLYVYMAGHRISLISGEYFFQNSGREQRVCVAAGQVALQVEGGDGIETIKPPSCARLAANTPVQVTARNPDDWIAVRRGYSIEATAATLLSQDAAPKPIINTAPNAVSSLPAPTAIPAPDRGALSGAGEPGGSTSSSSSSLPLGPVRAAPVLPTPAAAPRTGVAAALPVFTPTPPTLPPAPATTTAPIFIGQVQSTPVTKPLPSSSAVATTGSGQWALNIASYTEAAAAQKEAARLRVAGYPTASTQSATVNGKSWHRVQLTGFASDAAARAAAAELKAKLGLQNIWVLKP